MSGNSGTNLKSEIFTIPNILVYIRIILIPVFVGIYTGAKTKAQYCAAFVVMTIAFLTDFIDGKIARKFNSVTDLGKTIDPIADKLYQFAVALCLVLKIPKMMVIASLLFIKEISMGIMGLVLINKGGKVFGAKWYGKLCTGIIDITMVIFLVSPLVRELSDRVIDCMILVCVVLLVAVAVTYTRLFSAKIKEIDHQIQK